MMPKLRLHTGDNDSASCDPIPFPTGGIHKPSLRDSDAVIRDVERSLDEVQHHLGELDRLVNPMSLSPDDDRPRAA